MSWHLHDAAQPCAYLPVSPRLYGHTEMLTSAQPGMQARRRMPKRGADEPDSHKRQLSKPSLNTRSLFVVTENVLLVSLNAGLTTAAPMLNPVATV